MIAARLLSATLAACLAFAAPAMAEKAAKSDAPSGFGAIGGGGKDPIKIDADRLDVFDKENKAIFAGNVVAVQGESTIRCSSMTVFYKRGREAGDKDKGDAGGQEAAPKAPARTASRRWSAPVPSP